MNTISDNDSSAFSRLRQQLAGLAVKNAALEHEMAKPGSVYGGEPVADVVFGVAHGFSIANRALMQGLGDAGSDRYCVNSCQAQVPVVFSMNKGNLRVTPVTPDNSTDLHRIGSITLDLALTPPPTPVGGVLSAFQSISMPGDGNNWRADDPGRMLRHEGGGIWTGTFQLDAEAYKLAANGSWLVNWGAGGVSGGGNFDRIVSPGKYAVTWDENDPGRPLLVQVSSGPGAGIATFYCEKAYTRFGQSVYVTGNLPQLGSWDPARAIVLTPDEYPAWSVNVAGLPANVEFEWKFIIREDRDGKKVIAWEPGENHVSTTGDRGNIKTLRGTVD